MAASRPSAVAATCPNRSEKGATSLGRDSGKHSRRRRRALCPSLWVLPLLLLACGGSESKAGSPPPEARAKRSDLLAEQVIGDMIAAFTPPLETATSAVKDDWLRRRRALLARLRRGDQKVGSLILDAFRTRQNDSIPVRSGLIEAASLSYPAGATPILVSLVEDYGEDIGLRTDACRFLGSCAPERAIEVLGEILFDPQRSSTAPGDEALLGGWLDAHRALDRAPGIALANLATDIHRGQAARHLAIRALGDYPSKISMSALDEVIHESSGNSYMRRLAAQSMTRISEREQFCPIFLHVFEHEADINFQLFLENMINEHCQ